MYFRVESKIFTARVPIKMKKKRVYRSIVESVQIRFTRISRKPGMTVHLEERVET